MLFGIDFLVGNLVNNNWPPFPPFLISVDFKGRQSCLESTLPEVFILKGLRWRQNRAKWALILKDLHGSRELKSETGRW
jgi:hypothetical protein